MARILVVDDDHMTLKLARHMLSPKYEVAEMSSAADMFEYLKDQECDMILLDVHMPEMDGHEAIQLIKKDEKYRDIPVIFLTADADEEAELQGLQEGAADYITKPFRQEIALERINRILELNKPKEVEEFDALTGLHLRKSGEAAIRKAMEKGKGCLVFLDMDNLKKINDTIGHQTGDKLLKHIGRIINEEAADGVACRLGGDEFLIFLPQVDKEQARDTVTRMIDSFDECRKEDVSFRQASLSMGLCMTSPGDNYEEVYNNTDKALYHVKQNGKAGYFFYRKETLECEQEAELDIDTLIATLRKSGDYAGAMNVEYREFAKMFEYIVNMTRRFSHEMHLVMMNISMPTYIKDDVALLEEVMFRMEDAINRNVRTIDVCTRYSSKQFLLIMIDVRLENIHEVVRRICSDFNRTNKGNEVEVTYTVSEALGKNQ